MKIPSRSTHWSRERFGAAHLIDLLRGAETEKIARFGHHRLPTFGVGADRGKNEWHSLVHQMVATGYLRLDIAGYGGFGTTDKVPALLRGERVFLFREDTVIVHRPAPKREARTWESDRAEDLPPAGGKAEFAAVTGVGAAKLEQFADPFLAAIEAAVPDTDDGETFAEGARDDPPGRAVTRQVVITEKASQARDVRAAVGSHYGTVVGRKNSIRQWNLTLSPRSYPLIVAKVDAKVGTDGIFAPYRGANSRKSPICIK